MQTERLESHNFSFIRYYELPLCNTICSILVKKLNLNLAKLQIKHFIFRKYGG